MWIIKEVKQSQWVMKWKSREYKTLSSISYQIKAIHSGNDLRNHTDPWFLLDVLVDWEMGVNPGIEPLPLSELLVLGLKMLGARWPLGTLFGIDGAREVLLRGFWTCGCCCCGCCCGRPPRLGVVAWRVGSIIGQNEFVVSKPGFWRYVSHASW